MLANQDALSDEQVGLIRAFVQNGGGLVATEDSSLLTDWRLRRPKFGLADVFGLELPPKPGAPNTARLAGFTDPKLEAAPTAAALNRPVQRAFGRGRSVYVPRIEPSVVPPPPQIDYTFGNQYWSLPKNYKELVSAVEWASNNQLAAEIQAPLWVTVELHEQKSSNTWLLHLVNFDFTRPVRDIAVRVRVPAGMKVREAFVESPDFESRQALSTSFRENLVSFRVPRLQIYDLVQMKLEKQ